MSSNFKLVEKWMEDAGQIHRDMSRMDVIRLNKLTYTLIVEEVGEWKRELGDCSVNEVKEILDVIWVCYGRLAALGLDGDKMFYHLVENNYKKLSSKIIREDGKLGVPDDVKEALKVDINRNIEGELNGDLDI